MNILKKEHKLCVCCMEEHDVLTVKETQEVTYKGVKVQYEGVYEYCENTETFFANEEQMTTNYNALVNAYEQTIKEG